MTNKKKAEKQTVIVKVLSLITKEPELFINELSNLCDDFCATKNNDEYHFKYEINN